MTACTRHRFVGVGDARVCLDCGGRMVPQPPPPPPPQQRPAATDWPHTRRATSRLYWAWWRLIMSLGLWVAWVAVDKHARKYPTQVLLATAGMETVLSAGKMMDAQDAVEGLR